MSTYNSEPPNRITQNSDAIRDLVPILGTSAVREYFEASRKQIEALVVSLCTLPKAISDMSWVEVFGSDPQDFFSGGSLDYIRQSACRMESLMGSMTECQILEQWAEVPDSYVRFPDFEALMDEVLEASSAARDAEDEPSETHLTGSFRKTGKRWKIEYCRNPVICDHRQGFAYLALLIHNPGREFSPLELRQLASGTSSLVELYRPQELADQEALSDYKSHYHHLKRQLQEAEDNHDLAQIARLQEEERQFLSSMNEILSLSSKSRRFPCPRTMARQAVLKAVQRAMNYLEEAHPALHRHLRSSLHLRGNFTYLPSHPVIWDAA